MKVPSNTAVSFLELLEVPSHEHASMYSATANSNFDRFLQFALPDYTSPPLPSAIESTPEPFRSDDAMQAARDLDAAGLCVGENANATACQIIFTPPESSNGETSKVGIIVYGGALIDPRAYSSLAETLSTDHGYSVTIPIFEDDMAFKFGACNSGRVDQAQIVFPDVEKWVLVGHSFGGIAAFNDVWSMSAMEQKNSTDGNIGGVVMLASYVRQDLDCGSVDFSTEDWDWLPFASISASLDGVANATNFEAGQVLLPTGPLSSQIVIEGGNHGGFGTYNDTERKTLLFQTDGNATIAVEEQQSIAAGVIVDVAMAAENMIGGNEEVAGAKTQGNETVPETTASPTDTIDEDTEGHIDNSSEETTKDTEDETTTELDEAGSTESSSGEMMRPILFASCVAMILVALFA